jgi:5-methylcytosine-specific restriction endonuclease McrA
MRNTQVILICKTCQKEYKCKNYRKDISKYCSKECMYSNDEHNNKISVSKKGITTSESTIFKKGHTLSEETKLKISKSLKNLFSNGLKVHNTKEKIESVCLQCNIMFSMYPYEFEKGRKFCSKKCADRHKDQGKTTEAFRIRTSNKYKLWRTAVFERDNYICKICNRIGGKLNADHIKRFADFPELRLDVSNGRTLCEDCHRQTTTFGNKKQA